MSDWLIDTGNGRRVVVAKVTHADVEIVQAVDGVDLHLNLRFMTMGWDGWSIGKRLDLVPTAATMKIHTSQGEHNIGTFVADPRCAFSPPSHAHDDHRVRYSLRIARRALHRFEEARDGSDLTFEIWAHTLGFIGGALTAPVTSLRHTWTMNNAAWRSIVGRIGLQTSVDVEVRVPDDDEFPELARALIHLQGALARRASGEHASAMADCRLALDELPLAGFGGRAPKEVLAFLQQNAGRLSMSERFAVVRAALVIALSPSHHGGELRDELDRFDSQFAVATVSAFLGWAPHRAKKANETKE